MYTVVVVWYLDMLHNIKKHHRIMTKPHIHNIKGIFAAVILSSSKSMKLLLGLTLEGSHALLYSAAPFCLGIGEVVRNRPLSHR